MSWPVVAVGVMCEIVSGATPKSGSPEFWDGDVPWVTPKDLSSLENKHLGAPSRMITEKGLASCSAKLLPRGSLLFSSRAPIGLVAINQFPVATNQGFKSLVPDSRRADSDYLYWWFRCNRERLDAMGRGATFKEVSKQVVERIELPLPPIAEQQRIARILDAADALRAKRRESIAQLDALVQATFLEMFGDPATNPKGWNEVTLGDVVESVSDGPHVSPKYVDAGIPFLSTRNIRSASIDWSDAKYIDDEEAERQWRKCKPQVDDLLYTKGGTTGLAARVTTSAPFAVWVHVALIRPNVNLLNPAWFETMLNGDFCYRQSQALTRGIANRDLGLKRIRTIRLYLPPMAQQTKFASLLASIDKQRGHLHAHATELDILFASLQSRAFAGTL